ncbi:MAG: hypothetical protein ACNA8S_08970 [Deferrisomatales bacterium]
MAQRAALAAALSRAVGSVLERHVSPQDLRSRAPELRSTFLARPLPYIQRYSIVLEDVEGDELVMSVEAEIDRDSVLARLRALGVLVHVLPARPRVAVVPLGGSAAEGGARALRRVLEAQGYVTRSLPADFSQAPDQSAAARWARDLGCHVAFVLFPQAGGREASVALEGWIVEARRGDLLARGEAAAGAEAEDPVEAAARAARRAGERLAASLLARLEQSGWSLGEEVERFDLAVEGLRAPSLVEAIGRSLPLVAEVREATLREVRYGSAVWRLEARDAGLGPEALLGALRLPQGRLVWRETLPGDEGGVGVVRAEWVER